MSLRDSVSRELRAAGRSFVPTESNSFQQKAILITILFLWVTLEIGGWYAQAFYGVEMPPVLGSLRRIVFGGAAYTFGRVHGRERQRGR